MKKWFRFDDEASRQQLNFEFHMNRVASDIAMWKSGKSMVAHACIQKVYQKTFQNNDILKTIWISNECCKICQHNRNPWKSHCRKPAGDWHLQCMLSNELNHQIIHRLLTCANSWQAKTITHAHSLAYILNHSKILFVSIIQNILCADNISWHYTQKDIRRSDARMLDKILRLRPDLRNLNIEIWQTCKIN